MTTAEELFEKIRYLTRDGSGRGVTRESYSISETNTLFVLELEAKNRGLVANYDDVGNLWIDSPGVGVAPQVVIGSHVDSVAQGGNYDGLAGVIAGLEVLTRMKDELRRPRVVALRGEESAWLGHCYKGSKALFGHIDSDEVAQAIQSVAAPPPGRVGERLIHRSAISAFLELHIEQGPMLEAYGVPIAPVTSIRGNTRLQMECRGRADHSGTTPRDMRKDAVRATARALVELDNILDLAGSHRRQYDLVGTCGVINTTVGASVSKVADVVNFTVEFRSDSAETLEWAYKQFGDRCDYIASKYGASFMCTKQVTTSPVQLDGLVRQIIIDAVADVIGRGEIRLIASGAGHDAAVFASEGVPTGMIFVRNANGSHNPDEAMSMADFELGVAALERVARKLGAQ